MGVFQKLGIRNLAINFIDFTTWVRHYGSAVGTSIFKSLRQPKNGYFIITTFYFKNNILLRDNYSDPAIFKQVFYERQYFLERLANYEVNYIIDAGANVGFASLYFAELFPTAKIVAVEPEKNNFELLNKNTQNYKNIICVEAALWYKEEFIEIKNPDSLAASFIVEAKENAAIAGVTIEHLLATYQLPQIDLLKIDIEGAEKEIFSANTEWLQKVKLLIIELHDNYKPGCTKAFFKALESYNYEAFFNHENIFIFFQ